MSSYKIRPLANGEEDKLVDLWSRCGLTRPWNDPLTDINVAQSAKETEIFVGEYDGKIIASVIAGFDGHRGWVYYLAVAPKHQGQGYGRTMMISAERFLRDKNCAKLELMIRPENKKVRRTYENWGYEVEDRTLMVKWLIEPPEPQVEEESILDVDTNWAENGELPVAVTYLEMTRKPTKPARPIPLQKDPISLLKLKNCSVSYYRYLYNTIGEEYLWWQKRVTSNEVIHEIVTRDTTDNYVLSVGGIPAGWVQIDDLGNWEGKGQTVEIGYFGLFPEFIGRGLGGYFLDFAIHAAWDHKSTPVRIQVNTCSLDHPKALPTYQKFGFSPYESEIYIIDDPRVEGIIPAHVQLAQPIPIL